MVAMVLKFTFAIPPLLSLALRLCISPGVVNGIRFEERTLMEGAFDSLRGRL
jgi:hypothetical protein